MEEIDTALAMGYDAEVDVRVVKDRFYLGHDGPEVEVSQSYLSDRSDFLWIHCKNSHALKKLLSLDFNYFFHVDDDYTITSRGIVWAHPRAEVIPDSIVVLPEIYERSMNNIYGVCTDFPERYKGV